MIGDITCLCRVRVRCPCSVRLSVLPPEDGALLSFHSPGHSSFRKCVAFRPKSAGATGVSVVVFATSTPHSHCGYQPYRPPTSVFLTPSWVSTLPSRSFFRPLPLMGFSGFERPRLYSRGELSGTYASASDKCWGISPATCDSLPRVDSGAHKATRHGLPCAALALCWPATHCTDVSASTLSSNPRNLSGPLQLCALSVSQHRAHQRRFLDSLTCLALVLVTQARTM